MTDLATPHPLFLPDELEDPLLVLPGGELPEGAQIAHTISIRRTVDGRSESLGSAVASGELLSLDDISVRWGGGEYSLTPRDDRSRPIKGGTKRYVIPTEDNPPMSFTAARRRPPPLPPPAHAAPPAMAPHPSGMGPEVMMMMMKMQADSANAMMTMLQQSNAAQAAAAQAANAQLVAVIQQIGQMKAEGQKVGDTHQALLDGVALATELAGQQSSDKLGDTVAALVQGMVAAKMGSSS